MNKTVYKIKPKLPEDDFRGMTNEGILNLFENPNLKLVADINDGNFCYNYALKDNRIEDCETALEFLEDNYISIPLKYAKKGDVVSFHNEIIKVRRRNVLININHFGIIYKTDGTIQGTKIKSKWGCTGVFLTDFENLPEFYGKYIKIWRIKSFS
jgi:hypothetical protein